MFENDLYPGKPKILFVGNPTSSHVQGWINLLANAELNIRLFASAEGYPASDWPVKVYLITQYPPKSSNSEWRKSWWPEPEKWLTYENELIKINEIQKLTEEKRNRQEYKQVEKFREFFHYNTYHFIKLFGEIEDYFKVVEYEKNQQAKANAKGWFNNLQQQYSHLLFQSRNQDKILLSLSQIFDRFQKLQISQFISPLRAFVEAGERFQLEPIQLPESPKSITHSPKSWLAEVIKEWKPDIIHTFGLDTGSKFYYEARKEYHLEAYGKWIIKIFGGSDLAFTLHHSDTCRKIGDMFAEANQVLFDNQYYVRRVVKQGLLAPEKVCPLTPIPGSGGVAVDELVRQWQGQPSRRRVIVWPKSYETTWSKAVPVMLALQNVWDKIQPCEIHMLTVTGEMKEWFSALPDAMKAKCYTYEGLPRSKVLELLLSARVMLAPSLIDGVPNSMYEAMACGAIPVVSPLETIKDVATDANVLFARNLDQPAIEQAILKAMQDDVLVDEMAFNNLQLVKQLADTQWIQPKVQRFYENFA